MEKLAGLVTEEYYEKKLGSNPNYRLKIRVAPKAVLALVNTRLTEEVKQQLKENRAQHLGTLGRRTYTSQAGDIRVSASFSIGVTISHSGNNTTYEQLYERADRMLYQAKENGRDGYVIGSRGLNRN